MTGITDSIYSPASIQELLSNLDPFNVLQLLGIRRDKITQGPTAIQSFCPIHRDDRFTNLHYDPESRLAACYDLSCRISRVSTRGVNLIELYALAKSLTFDLAADELAKGAGVHLEYRSPDETLEQQFLYREFTCYAEDPARPTELVPTEFTFEGQKVVGRGLILFSARNSDFLKSFARNAFQSRFLYDIKDPEAIQKGIRERTLPLMGNYYIVFRATSSSEIVHAINQAIDSVEILRTTLDLPLESIHIYYSGRQIEIEVDHIILGILPHPDLPKVFAKMTEKLLGPASNGISTETRNFSQIDLSAYTPDSLTYLVGSAVSVPKNTFKIEIPFNLFKKINYVTLNELAQKKPETREQSVSLSPTPRASQWYAEIVTEVEGAERYQEDRIRTIFYEEQVEAEEFSPLSVYAPALMKSLFSNKERIVPTPSQHLNAVLGGGLQPGSLLVIAGPPGSGISTFCFWLILSIAKQKRNQCFYVSFQQGIEDLFKKALSHTGKIPMKSLTKYTGSNGVEDLPEGFRGKLFEAYEEFKSISPNITILEGARASDLSFLRGLLRNASNNTRSNQSPSTPVVVIDTLQLLTSSMNVGFAADTLSIEHVTRKMKHLARETDATIIATAEYFIDCKTYLEPKQTLDPQLQRIHLDTQSADTVGLLVMQGASLECLHKYLSVYTNGARAMELVKTIDKRLSDLEKKYRAEEDFDEFNSCFVLLDIRKNRGSLLSKLVFLFRRAISEFVPIDYIQLEEELDHL